MKPNVIIFNSDQMRKDCLKHMGNQAAFTPNLDSLAKEGVSFSNAFCQNPVCVPSRCSFMSGLYPHVNGHRTMSNLMKPDEQNLFSDMKSNGYYTISSTRGDLMAGQYPSYHKKYIDKYLPLKYAKNPNKSFSFDRGSPDSDTYYSFLQGKIPTKSVDGIAKNPDDLTVDAAIKAIKNRPKNQPFFMFLGIFYPHPPYQIEEKYYRLIDKTKLQTRIPCIKDDDNKPKMEVGLRDRLRISNWQEQRLDEIRTIYLAMCAKVDEQVGRIISALKQQGIYDDTALLFFSDHGDYTTDFGLVEKSQNCFPDCLVNVPFIIKPPKNIQIDNGVNDNLVELTDVCATIAALTDVKIERTHFSRSLLKTMQDKNVSVRDCVFSEGGRLIGETHCMEYDPKTHTKKDHYAPRLELQSLEDGTHGKAVMIRDLKYKYIKRLEETDEFYDLAIGESKNLINNPEYTAKINEFKQKMLDWYIQTCDVVPNKLDERFPWEFLVNNAVAIGIPRFLMKTLVFFLKLFKIKLSSFMRFLQGSVEKE